MPVEVGIYDSEKAQILSGIDAGTLVLTTWNSELYDGASATLESEAAAGETQTQQTEETSADEQ